MANTPYRSSEFCDELLELQTTVDSAMADGVITLAERRAIKQTFRAVQRDAETIDQVMHRIGSYAKNWRLSTTATRYHGGSDDEPLEAA